MKNQKNWINEDIQFLLDSYTKFESYILAEKLGRSNESVYNKLWRLRKSDVLKSKKIINLKKV